MPTASGLGGLVVVAGLAVGESFRVGVVEDFRRILLAGKLQQDFLQYYKGRK
jgi:hypothetical protein